MDGNSETIVLPSTSDLASLVADDRPAAVLRSVACVGGLSIERDISTSEIHDYLQETDNLVWLDVQDPGEAELEMLLEQFGFHPLSVEDVVHPDQRPKVDEYKGYLFVVVHSVRSHEGYRDVELCEVDLFVGRNYLVTVHRGKVPALEEAYHRWTNSGSE